MPAVDVVGDLVDVVAIGGDAAFGAGHFGFALEQRPARRLRHWYWLTAITPIDSAPAAEHGDGQAGCSDLHPRGDGDEADLALRAHEEFALRKPAPQALPADRRRLSFSSGPRLSRPKLCRAWLQPRASPASNPQINLSGRVERESRRVVALWQIIVDLNREPNRDSANCESRCANPLTRPRAGC